jgi:hypothetical protein
MHIKNIPFYCIGAKNSYTVPMFHSHGFDTVHQHARLQDYKPTRCAAAIEHSRLVFVDLGANADVVIVIIWCHCADMKRANARPHRDCHKVLYTYAGQS